MNIYVVVGSIEDSGYQVYKVFKTLAGAEAYIKTFKADGYCTRRDLDIHSVELLS